MVLRRALLTLLAATAALVAGCSNAPTAPALPDANSLLKDASASAAKFTSTHFSLTTNGSVPGLSVQKLDGDLTKAGGGAAKGTGILTMLGQRIEGEFVLAGGSLYLKGPTGGFQKIPAALSSSLYDPSAILDPQRGIPKMLASVQNAKTEGEESIDGTPTYKVTGTIPKDAMNGLLPGITADANATLWLRKDAGHAPVKASLAFPGNASVDVTLSDVDKPVTVTPPA
jgi:lipoprotein LprG